MHQAVTQGPVKPVFAACINHQYLLALAVTFVNLRLTRLWGWFGEDIDLV